MIAILYSLYFALGGILIVGQTYSRAKASIRVWLGLCFGVVMEMWLPALFAYAFRFSVAAHLCSAILLLLVVILVMRRHPTLVPIKATDEEKKLFRILLFLVLPLTAFSGYLQYTHVLMPAEDGSYWCGQSTYGDLCMHLSFITSLRNASFPPSYNLLYGTGLAYPYLTDSLSTTHMLLGLPINLAVVIPGTYLMFLTYVGFCYFAFRILGNRPLVITAAFLFFFLNGGLGFFYDFDLSFRDHFERVQEIFSGFYKTPANQPEFNLRFSNVIADLMIPQRSLLGGWAIVLPAFYCLLDAFETKSRRALFFLILFAGALPLIHTHTFLALGLFSGGYILALLLLEKEKRRTILSFAGIYLLFVLILALPQLLGNAIKQTVSGGFMRFQFNWVNNSGGSGFIDGYFWFWIKNAGLPYLLMICAILNCRRRHTMPIVFGMMSIYLVAELVLFQPNEYDNNKLFYLWYVFAVILAADYGYILMKRLEGLRGRMLLCILFIGVSIFSGMLSLAREAVSSYQLFSSTAVKAGTWIDEHTDREAVFMTGQQHINPVCSLAGRQIVCGSDLYVFFHGLDYTEQRNDCLQFYAHPVENEDILKKYGIDYICLSDYERSEMFVDTDALDEQYDLVYENRDVRIYSTGFGEHGAGG